MDDKDIRVTVTVTQPIITPQPTKEELSAQYLCLLETLAGGIRRGFYGHRLAMLPVEARWIKKTLAEIERAGHSVGRASATRVTLVDFTWEAGRATSVSLQQLMRYPDSVDTCNALFSTIRFLDTVCNWLDADDPRFLRLRNGDTTVIPDDEESGMFDPRRLRATIGLLGGLLRRHQGTDAGAALQRAVTWLNEVWFAAR